VGRAAAGRPGGGRFKRREESLLSERRLIACPGRNAAVTTPSLPLVGDRFASHATTQPDDPTISEY